jgi:hypothetical protein
MMGMRADDGAAAIAGAGFRSVRLVKVLAWGEFI